jgi:hypothetical protein
MSQHAITLLVMNTPIILRHHTKPDSVSIGATIPHPHSIGNNHPPPPAIPPIRPHFSRPPYPVSHYSDVHHTRDADPQVRESLKRNMARDPGALIDHYAKRKIRVTTVLIRQPTTFRSCEHSYILRPDGECQIASYSDFLRLR